MKRSSSTEERSIGVLREREAGGPTAEIGRRRRTSEQTFCRCKSKCGGMGPSDSGKTMFFNAVSGLVGPCEGSVRGWGPKQ
jgi:hypothetical protein